MEVFRCSYYLSFSPTAKEELEKKQQDYLNNRIKELQRDHDVDKALAIKTSLSNAKTEWMIEAEANTKEKVKKAIEMAREQWTNEGIVHICI